MRDQICALETAQQGCWIEKQLPPPNSLAILLLIPVCNRIKKTSPKAPNASLISGMQLDPRWPRWHTAALFLVQAILIFALVGINSALRRSDEYTEGLYNPAQAAL